MAKVAAPPAEATTTGIDHFHAHGWATFEGVFERERAEELAGLAEELAARDLEEALAELAAANNLDAQGAKELLGKAASGDAEALGRVQALVGSNANASGKNEASPQTFDPDFDPSDLTRLAPRKLEDPYGKDERYRAFVHDAGLHRLAHQLLGGDEPPLLWGSQLFMKPPEIGTVKPWHQDNYYFRVQNDADVLTLWIALDDADKANGCMHFVDRSIAEAEIVAHSQDPTRATYLIAETTAEERDTRGYGEVRAGGVVAWSGATIHGSEANQTGRWRRAYAVHFVKPGFSMQEGVPTPDLSKLNDAQAGGNAGADSAFHSRL